MNPHGQTPGRQGSALDLLLELARRLRRQALEATDLGLSPHQARALRVLHAAVVDAGAGVRVSELAQSLRIAPRSTTEVLDALQDAGMIVRSPDPADRRAVLVSPTDRGRQAAEAIVASRRAEHARILAALTSEEERQLRTLLSRLVDELDQPAQ